MEAREIEGPRGACDGEWPLEDRGKRVAPRRDRGKRVARKIAGETGTPLPLGFSQVLILKEVKVLCFDTLLQVLILNVVKVAVPQLLSIERWAEYVRFIRDNTRKSNTDLDVCQ
jgi:hypothetical protein